MNYLYASTNLGCEKLLENELIFLGAKNLHIIKGGIYYEGEDLLLYRSLIWSRIASRIYLCIKNFIINSKSDLYSNIAQINWDKILYLHNTFLVKFKGQNNIIKNSLFGSLTIKDAIVDQFYKKYSMRPNIDLINPNIRIKALLIKNKINIMLDLCGNSLHQRCYRKFSHITPIKENLGAAIVLSSTWTKNIPLIDPMCGSGTLLIEAAMIYSDRAPGLKRDKWSFKFWKGYNSFLWNKILNEANTKFKIRIKKCNKNLFIGYDYNNTIIKQAKENAFNANVLEIIQFSTSNLNNLTNPYKNKEIGTLLSNPPYGEREHTENSLVALYVQMGFIFKKHFKNWKLSIFTASKFLSNFLQMQAYEELFFKNGPLNCFLKNYKIFSEILNQENKEYENRLKKNIQKLKKWNDLKQIECFRIYDRDIPNYNIIVDIYKNWLVIQEYQAPKKINIHYSYKRLCYAIYCTKEILSIPINNIVFKTRKKQKYKLQYQKLFNSKKFFIIQEYHVKLLINLFDYLDTGIFLEHRCTRKLISTMSHNKDFLNLFAYTGSASVYAGLGGAKSTTTVDISNTYIKWSIKNMSINNLIGKQHSFIQSNCLEWIESNYQKFDLIFINPPTFSNSKKMKKFFELKKDYLNLLNSLKKNLRKNGYIIFSSSTNNFKLNFNEINKIKLHVKNITNSVQSKDCFNKKYYSWLIKHI
ncbi:bifunctional 23S rRNA (guanine(2069)-N(7))-methyltransferase RlmK/23S rRNA (guanine(2445)-N(2))-methyltransferase RlmL [Buchnera aphidicola (Aphis nasturtii)]|uniref:bifunctional 23S rRNA (guanine(2069)-N(7))-methyltransferase RlmK/23S rRNA (guanine(2445)-N(2))-methyltransferase RlmL n=1 Tax=Buchnera aphidicola TaxID=9 RepID=UPI0010C3673A|nr:bifunctional 23S rRNA (guanine(2069)-N(7))-methyltransferase RlmK/23S rRNA (guanine(2445)-N(2))-methyltransferase RlmL [Buchnera aphidicola]QCI18333.1 bifunctional 23S rRNA (guanine(2069)-N(7))-methyltransferase RlmK/23S rRNA (guanine(2445)-N(2))-methyltransferase RlmL [Buchnera aphidicola (Aphis nasturtii)]